MTISLEALNYIADNLQGCSVDGCKTFPRHITAETEIEDGEIAIEFMVLCPYHFVKFDGATKLENLSPHAKKTCQHFQNILDNTIADYVKLTGNQP